MIQELLNSPIVTLFLILAIGIIVGQISIKGISLDISAIILVAIVFGHFGFSVPPILQDLGLLLFIYSIGVQAGPGFLSSMKSQGRVLLSLATLALSAAAIMAGTLSYLYGLEPAFAAGVFTGAITSAPGLAVALESSHSPLASIGYSVTYPAGILGVILITKFMPNILRMDVKEEEKRYRATQQSEYPEIFGRYFKVSNQNIFDKTIGDLAVRNMTGGNITRHMHDGIATTPSSNTVLQENDIIKAVGTEDAIRKMTLLIGQETDEKIPLSRNYDVRRILVSNKKVVNASFGELGIFERYNATAARLRRSGIDLTPTKHTKIKLGDVITVSAPSEQIVRVCQLFGDSPKKLDEFNILPVALTILIGILLGKITVPVGSISFSLGLTGGVLAMSLLLSYIGRTGPIVWNISGNTNQLLRKIGLMLFLASVGTSAGATFAGTFMEYGFVLILIGFIVTITPMALCVIAGKFILKLNLLTLLGGLTGSMTSTPALSAVEGISETDAIQSAYATVYPIALVVMIVLSQLLVSIGQLLFEI